MPPEGRRQQSLQRRRAGELRPTEKYELLILGQGSAAFAAAIKANESKIKTAMVGGNATNGAVIGGTCVNVGCMPSKRLITVGTSFYNGTSNSFKGIEYGNGKLNFRKVDLSRSSGRRSTLTCSRILSM
jgi:pyruvate/2-oxoglutarate dehydrogenase complex dihydrolipoamide dehydrogenase (E3) component